MPKLFGTPGTRALSPTVCTSQSLASCSIGAQLLFDRLIVQADDQGRQEAEPHILKAHCFPYVADATPKRISGWLEELADGGMVTVYRVGSVSVVQLTGWWTHQPKPRRAYPSRWPAPDGWQDQTFGTPQDAGATPPGGPQSAGSLPATRGKNPAPSVSVSGSISVSGAEARARDDGGSAEPYATLERLTRYPIPRFEPSAIRAVDALVDRRGVDAVVEAAEAVAPTLDPQPPAPWPLVAAIRNRLEPIGQAERLSPKERKEREIADIVERTRREAAAARAQA